MAEPALVTDTMVMEAVKTMDQKNRTADKERRPIEQGIPVWLGVGIQGVGIGIQTDRLGRQRVDLLRQAGRIQRDLPAAIELLARYPGGVLRLPSNRHLRGEVAAILNVALRCSLGHLCWAGRCVHCARRDLPRTPRQDRQCRDTQKGTRTSISRNRPPEHESGT